ncbi:hypothetical protein B0T18DRAFT_410248 [Schizothecium vesticola]|uniref:Uncharacterized protein n=1 Tax=Schizothecium vesticola TaxID=314040 RepID=A0AA40K4Q0_9PEZI|nr:hypothetical protein B0T18DRAFT_410248 [Schizothecium vesticola]
MASDGETSICGLDGNPDLTGLGVRSAFYLQTISFAIAGEFLDSEAGYLHSSAIGLLLAIIVALLRETIRGTLLAPEVSVVMWLFSLQLFASFKTARKSALLTLRLHQFLILAFIGYATWFWFKGLDILPQTACTEWAFFFAKVELRGWFRTLSKVIWGMVCGFTGLIILWTIVYLIVKGQTQTEVVHIPTEADGQFAEMMTFFFPEGQTTLPGILQDAPSLAKAGVMSIFMTLAVLRNSLFLVVILVSVELQVHWNSIRGVQSLDSVSQLIPFIVALGQLVHVVYTTVRGKDAMDRGQQMMDFLVHPVIRQDAKQYGTVKPPRCPKRDVSQLDEEQHEMIEAAEEPAIQDEIPSRESVDADTVSDIGQPPVPTSPIDITDTAPMSDIQVAQRLYRLYHLNNLD